MRKLFGQKSKHKPMSGSSLVMSLAAVNKDEEKQTITASNIPIITTSENETKTNVDDIVQSNDNGEKSTKLFVVVSDADPACSEDSRPEKPDRRLLNVDECQVSEPVTPASYRQRSSTCSSQNFLRPRDHNSKKILKDAIRRRSWMVFQSQNSSSAEVVLPSPPVTNMCRLRRYRISLSEPSLTSHQINPSYQTSPSVKSSPRTSSASTTTQSISLLTRRPNLTGMNLGNIKHSFRKQLSPRQQTLSVSTPEPNQDLNVLDDDVNRRWSLTSVPSSSGYGTTSPPSSQYSSFERLQHHLCSCKQQSDTNPSDGFQHLESRSISMSLLDANVCSSPSKLMFIPDQDMNTMAYIYKERYPKAKVQMEERLQSFIDTHKVIDKFDYCSDGSARFIHNQIVELAKDCLNKSTNELITNLYFNEMTDNLERLLLNAQEKCPHAVEDLQGIVRKLLLITARSARLLECLHFDPENFLRTLEEVECQAKTITNVKKDIPKYICSQLNLERNPFDVIDGLQVTESSEQSEEKSLINTSVTDNENDSLIDSNYLTITPNTIFPSLERSTSMKGPCEEDFEVLKLISNGAYGAVHLVKHRQTQERYAMKKISKTHLILRNQIEQAFVERDIMTFTDNPFVVALICTFETKNHLCLVMEYVEGGDVATLLKNIGGPLNIDIARMYFAETTLAVEYLHSYGIIHRDLKPDNLLITAVGHIKLTDFGLSKIGLMSLTTNFYEKHIDKETKAFNDKQICGTPSYIAPEVILRQGYGKAVDWWSVGIILYEFLVGIPPFTGNTPDELFANVISGEIDWSPLMSDGDGNYSEDEVLSCAKHLIEQLLEPDPSKRLGTLAGAYEIRSHPFCSCINWSSLLREKADFVPVLESPDDTSYFDTRQDRYKHSDDEDDHSLSNNDSDSLFASFSSVSIKYASELSGTHKQTKSNRGSVSSSDVSRANSCTESTSPFQIDFPNEFQISTMNKSMSDDKAEPTFGSGTFEPIPVSSDESESSSSTRKTGENNEKKPSPSSTKHYKQRKISVKLLEQQNSVDSSDDNHQEKNKSRCSRKTRIPRALSPIQPKQNTTLITPIVSISNEHCSSSCKPGNCPNQQQKQQRSFPRSLSKSFSSSSSSSSPPPPPFCIHNQDDRSCRQAYRQNMTFSPLEHDAYSSRTLSPSHSIKNNLRPPIIIHRGPRSFGFTLRAVKVFHGNTDYYTTQHVVVAVHGPAAEAGLKPNDVITHVNERPVAGLLHPEVVKLILGGSETLSIRAIPCSETQIRTGGRRRSPSKQKLRYCQQSEKKSFTAPTHQSHCQKYSMNSSGANTLTTNGTNSNRKNSQSTSLFRRLSERKVARDMEAAAAAGERISLKIPTAYPNPTPSNAVPTSTTPTNVLSSSLPVLLYNNPSIPGTNNERSPSSHHELDPSEWPPLNQLTLSSNESNSSQITTLPSILKQKSQTSNPPLVKSVSANQEPTRPSLCKTTSEPPRLFHQKNTNSDETQVPVNNDAQTENDLS